MTALTAAGLAAICLTPMAAAGTWLLITDPALAAETAASGSLTPVGAALLQLVGRALAGLLTYL